MILFEVLWDNGLLYEDYQHSSKVFSTLEKAQNYFNNYNEPSHYSSDETLTLSSFDEDDILQRKTTIAIKSIPFVIDSGEEYDIDSDDEYDMSNLTSDFEEFMQLIKE